MKRLAILFSLFAAPAVADTESEHNELHAGFNAAIDLLFADGCIHPALVRDERLKLIKPQDSNNYLLVGKEYTATCKRWAVFPAPPTPNDPEPNSLTLRWGTPTTKRNGDALLSSEIQAYEVYECSTVATLIAVTNANQFTVEKPGIYCLRTVTVNGIKSKLSVEVEL